MRLVVVKIDLDHGVNGKYPTKLEEIDLTGAIAIRISAPSGEEFAIPIHGGTGMVVRLDYSAMTADLIASNTLVLRERIEV